MSIDIILKKNIWVPKCHPKCMAGSKGYMALEVENVSSHAINICPLNHNNT
jgi:hypothetical protein